MASLSRRSQHSTNIWPGFVDALATLLMVIIFLLMIFVIAQFFLGEALSGRDQALMKLENQVSELADLLSLERQENEDMRANVAQMSEELRTSVAQRDDLNAALAAMTLRAEGAEKEVGVLNSRIEDALSRIDLLTVRAESAEDLATRQTARADKAEAENARLAARAEEAEAATARLNARIDESEQKIAALDSRAGKAEEEAAAQKTRAEAAEKEAADQKSRADEAEGLSARLSRQLEDAYKTVEADRETIEVQLKKLAVLTANVQRLEALKEELEKEITQMAGKAETTGAELIEERKLSESARAEVALLNKQMAALRTQLQQLTAALEVSEKLSEEQKVQISTLGKRLNAALASRVQELSQYRSEFFGRLRKVLGEHPGIRIVGDRFVFQSEVLFETGQAEIEDAGTEQLAQLANTLTEIAVEIPDNIDWILRVDGHTDKVPIRSAKFPSNWELSTARAISVVRFLIDHGIPPNRLAATGFGQFQPLDTRDDEIGYRRNRRIELKLTQR